MLRKVQHVLMRLLPCSVWDLQTLQGGGLFTVRTHVVAGVSDLRCDCSPAWSPPEYSIAAPAVHALEMSW